MIGQIDALRIGLPGCPEAAILTEVAVRRGNGSSVTTPILNDLASRTVWLLRLRLGRVDVAGNVDCELTPSDATGVVALVEDASNFLSINVANGLIQ